MELDKEIKRYLSNNEYQSLVGIINKNSIYYNADRNLIISKINESLLTIDMSLIKVPYVYLINVVRGVIERNKDDITNSNQPKTLFTYKNYHQEMLCYIGDKNIDSSGNDLTKIHYYFDYITKNKLLTDREIELWIDECKKWLEKQEYKHSCMILWLFSHTRTMVRLKLPHKEILAKAQACIDETNKILADIPHNTEQEKKDNLFRLQYKYGYKYKNYLEYIKKYQ